MEIWVSVARWGWVSQLLLVGLRQRDLDELPDGLWARGPRLLLCAKRIKARESIWLEAHADHCAGDRRSLQFGVYTN